MKITNVKNNKNRKHNRTETQLNTYIPCAKCIIHIINTLNTRFKLLSNFPGFHHFWESYFPPCLLPPPVSLQPPTLRNSCPPSNATLPSPHLEQNKHTQS